jgi:hypothetical protein
MVTLRLRAVSDTTIELELNATASLAQSSLPSTGTDDNNVGHVRIELQAVNCSNCPDR